MPRAYPPDAAVRYDARNEPMAFYMTSAAAAHAGVAGVADLGRVGMLVRARWRIFEDSSGFSRVEHTGGYRA